MMMMTTTMIRLAIVCAAAAVLLFCCHAWPEYGPPISNPTHEMQCIVRNCTRPHSQPYEKRERFRRRVQSRLSGWTRRLHIAAVRGRGTVYIAVKSISFGPTKKLQIHRFLVDAPGALQCEWVERRVCLFRYCCCCCCCYFLLNIVKQVLWYVIKIMINTTYWRATADEMMCSIACAIVCWPLHGHSQIWS